MSDFYHDVCPNSIDAEHVVVLRAIDDRMGSDGDGDGGLALGSITESALEHLVVVVGRARLRQSWDYYCSGSSVPADSQIVGRIASFGDADAGDRVDGGFDDVRMGPSRSPKFSASPFEPLLDDRVRSDHDCG